ncbi:G1/S-specific cyclin-E2 isoform X1 [Leucoraja erinacea]|uniref:G1/S-specific cyclin-E2 isoform X1 n=1 Tax=Leucoraja erinaceus TaxID=7782 RepID=UPI002453E892|nr:G1/S-specific cyclin-E2 isoform X1 [Leucoraja erinacea]XP_055489671.1 G1/S-specific cyclin-E2 isoform X1 [Leucoraja erinacea]
MSRRSDRLQARQTKAEEQSEDSAQSKKREAETCRLRCNETEVGKRRRQFQIQNCWAPIAPGAISPCILIPTPHKDNNVTDDFSKFSQYRFKNLFLSKSPLPPLGWGNSEDVWSNMLKKEIKYTHSKTVLLLHPSLQPKMRAILLDWLIEVCDVYTLHRETFYLAQDFFDRFMFTQENVHKSKLQLIGIASLFIAAKLEEIYPPKLNEFAYVTDGACTETEILDMELIILKALKWELCPVTIICWLNIYLQIVFLKEIPNISLPQYSQDIFVQIAQLLDLCILDVESLSFPYGVLAAAAVCYYTSIEDTFKASGLRWESISTCFNWMAPFAKTLSEGAPVKLRDFKHVANEDGHNVQTHIMYLDMLDEVHVRRSECTARLSPVSIGGILTPPKSTEKPSSSSSP